MTREPLELVCIGGTLCDDRVFAPMLSQLSYPAQSWHPVHYDRIGNAAKALIDVAPHEFVALGFSLGGFVALETLRLAPERVRAVVLVSGNAYPDTIGNAPARRHDVEEAKAMGLAAFIRTRARMLVADDAVERDDIIQVIATMAVDLGHTAHGRQVEANIHRPDFREFLRTAPSPVLAIAGLHDQLCPSERYFDLENAPSVRLRMVDTGHFVPLEAPRQCAALIDEFMTGLGT